MSSIARSARGAFPYPELPRRAVAVPAPPAAARRRVAATASCCMCMARRSRPRCRSRTASMAAPGATNCAPPASMSGAWISTATAIPIHIPPCPNRRMDASRSALRRMPAGRSNRLCVSSVIGSHAMSGFPSSRIPGARSRPVASPHVVRAGRAAGAVRCHRSSRRQPRRRAIRPGVWFRSRINGSASPRRCRPANRRCCPAAISPNGASAIWTAIRPAGRERRPASDAERSMARHRPRLGRRSRLRSRARAGAGGDHSRRMGQHVHRCRRRLAVRRIHMRHRSGAT